MDLFQAEGRCLIIGEVAQSHDGSLGLAHAFVDAIAAAGADAVKFQTHIAAEESSPGEPWRVKFSRQDASRFDYWKRMEFTAEQWAGLRDHAHQRGLIFLSSPFSLAACELLERLGMPAWKVASGEFNNPLLFDFIARTGKPVLLSTGMAGYAEIGQAVERVRAAGNPLTVFQCTSSYPCPPEMVGLNVIGELRRRFGCRAGLSDHSGTIFPALAAAQMGVEAIEIHVTLSRDMFGPDVPASVTSSEFRQMVEGIRFIERMRAAPVDKDAVAADMAGMRNLFTKSVVARRTLAPGRALELADLDLRKPGTGIPADRLPDLVGKVLVRPVVAGAFLAEADFLGADATATQI
jgi:N-acetylneuraminate synthase